MEIIISIIFKKRSRDKKTWKTEKSQKKVASFRCASPKHFQKGLSAEEEPVDGQPESLRVNHW